MLSGSSTDTADFRRARRSADRYRLRSDGPRSDDLCRCLEHRRTLWHRFAGSRARSAEQRARRIGKARRSAARPRSVEHDCHACKWHWKAAAAVAREQGVAAYILSDAIEGEARDVGKVLAGVALQVAERGQPVNGPCVLLSGGETTVTVRGKGRGGRNVEFLLSLAIALDGHRHIHALAGDTDGVDGQEEIAGAHIGPASLARAESRGLRPKEMLADNDAHGFFSGARRCADHRAHIDQRQRFSRHLHR